MTRRDRLLASVAVVFVAALLFTPFPSTGLWSREVVNSGHVFLFVPVSWLLFYVLKQRFVSASRWRLYGLVLLLGLVLGAAIEFLQLLVQREASWDDWLKNLFGLLAGMAFIEWLSMRRVAAWWRQGLVLMLFAGIVIAGLFPFIVLSLHYLQRGQAFPVVMDFTSPWASSFVRYHHAEKLPDDTGKVTIRLEKGDYPGVSVIEVEPDWAAYKTLEMTVFSPQADKVDVPLRVNDRWHDQRYTDRFNRRFVIRPGENRISVSLADIEQAPVGRKMDMKNIAEIKLFVADVKESLVLGLGAVYLQ